MTDAIQCWDGDGDVRHIERLHVECEHFAYVGTNITDTRKRAHALLKLFGGAMSSELAHLRNAMRMPMKWVEFRYLQDNRSISARFYDVTISRMKNKYNGTTVFLHYAKVEDRNDHHG